jgi:hypothetical protein
MEDDEGESLCGTADLLPHIGRLRKMKNLDFSKLVSQRRLTVLSFTCLLPFQVVFPGLNISFVTNLLIFIDQGILADRKGTVQFNSLWSLFSLVSFNSYTVFTIIFCKRFPI